MCAKVGFLAFRVLQLSKGEGGGGEEGAAEGASGERDARSGFAAYGIVIDWRVDGCAALLRPNGNFF